MRDARSSKPNAVKLTNFHIFISSVAAIAGVAIAAYQAVQPPHQPVNVVVAMEPPKATPDSVIEKSDAIPAIATRSVELGRDAIITAALKDGSENRYSFTNLFDGRDDTFLAIKQSDGELNMLVTFRNGTSRPVTAIEYNPPQGVDPAKLATTVDLMVLPDGQLEASGRPVISFSLLQSSESHIYPIPGHAEGKGLWLRVSGIAGAEQSYVGDFRILSEGVAP